MSFKRDIKIDRKETNMEILRNRKSLFNGESWLGHTKDCGIIDHELLNGATRDEIIKRSGREPSGVDGHISHLKSEHGLMISKNNELYKFEYYHSESNKGLTKNDIEKLTELEIDKVVENCIVQIENSDNIKKWYSIGIGAMDKNGEEIRTLIKNKGFAQSLLNKRIGDFVDFGKGFKIISIKKYLS
jgi:hypothetical protein